MANRLHPLGGNRHPSVFLAAIATNPPRSPRIGTDATPAVANVDGTMPVRPTLIEFPADDPERARRFWSGLLGTELQDRTAAQGSGWQTATGGAATTGSAATTVGVHERGRGPGDTVSLPYFTVDDLEPALAEVRRLGGSVIHPGERFAICRDSEGSPFGLAAG